MSSGPRSRTREREVEGVRHYHTHVSEIGRGVANRSELPDLIPSSTSDYPGSNGVHANVYNTLHIHQNQKQERVIVSETHADPHNSHRGFFFSHVGWLMMRRHPAVKKYGSKIDMSDVKNDPVIQFFDKYYTPIMLFAAFVLPTMIPVYCWNESWSISFRAVIIRYVWLLNATFAVNSFAHMFGNRPYNKTTKPTENSTVAFFTLGEGWHSYHHTFPWDYKAAELGAYGLNPTTAFIDIMSWFGLAYDLKKVNKELVERISRSKGDGTDSYWGNKHSHY
ncbi:hypothetical protein G9C98_004165 [Cotesia typhae]|uniref:Fatty acid desaturase domain-containing protein n=1 Tax=Cotesia typhae TaxID=2053667 RepID=A0A8J5V8U2_9HYME|nr:hypothetical protein G9C98_004165 [Cotesia typhae]